MIPVSANSTVSGIQPLTDTTMRRTESAQRPNGSFGDLVKDFVAQTNQDQLAADSAIKDLVTGKTDDVHQVVMAVANAELSFQLFMEIRNQLVSSYNELMRMQF